ncbi:MAG TPA: hypothetical protein VLY23_00965 [Candidatus Acidoferrum sp.]|nr:hypothetical protein [Candidatus Acidoferrum sp.]
MQQEQQDYLEAQYWWAFSCLALAGQRTAAEFHVELLHRTAGKFPTAEEVEAILDEAVANLGDVLNAGLHSQASRPAVTGWKKHLLALSMRPEEAKRSASDD